MAPSDEREAPIDVLGEDDLEAAMALSEEAGWNQVAADWLLMLRLGSGFAVRDGGRVVATALALPYPPVFGWVSMVLVHTPYRRRGLAARPPGDGEAAVGVEMDRGERLAQREAGSPGPLDAGDLARGEDLADRDRGPIRLRHQQTPDVHTQHVGLGGGETPTLRLEEVGEVTRGVQREPDLREGGLVPDDLRAGERGDTGRRLEPDRLLRIAVVVADPAVTVGAAPGDEAGAGEGGAVDAVRRLVG